jgi:diguanylate cyclase (GGDEF)-like protein
MNHNITYILVVDDRPENLLVLEGLLEDLPCNIVKASSGNEALGLMLEYDFALVLLDVQMPEMDGFETAALMRSREITRNIPIVFVTALYKEQKYIFKGYEIGAVDYLFKPIEAVILRSKVNVFLELNKQKLQLKEQADSIKSKLEELQELQETNKELQSLSMIDGLTKIPNRRSFDENIKKIWKDSIRNDTQISIIIIDIDFFKAYNDHYGHLQGDDCLIKVAQRLMNSIKRPRDVVARYGGEEFAVILPETDLEGANFVAETIRMNIEGLQIPHEYSHVSPYVTISLGVYSNNPNSSSLLEQYMAKADAALYYAKSMGRNRVCKSKE